MKRYWVIVVGAVALAVACKSQKSRKESNTPEPRVDTTELVAPKYEVGTRRMERTVGNIGSIRNIEELNYAVEHFWDGFDFESGERVVEYDTVDICQAIIDYTLLVRSTGDFSHMRSLMERAGTSREVLDFFITVTDMVLHDPNSPMRDDELYIPVLEYLVASPLLDEYDRLIPEHDLHIAKQNRIGRKANNIIYTTASGTSGELYDVEADYTLLMFNNPDCPACREIINNIEASPLMNEMQEMGRLRVVAIYPDADLEAWYRYIDKMPRRWVISYDKGQRITEDRSYDLRAIPSLYLLDRDKRVLVKDGVNVAYIEDVIALCESNI
jgi:thiol-disulfide isomerase/thioredoxin